jgi:hypothetical protein
MVAETDEGAALVNHCHAGAPSQFSFAPLGGTGEKCRAPTEPVLKSFSPHDHRLQGPQHVPRRLPCKEPR